ncbi:hydrogenase nickel incorporation protein HypB [Mycolicibacterium celeriflavum]|uniref:Hydrogenase accessory protein HypB n=1 Tax=Mycolicibacterium celeriflavum TaxID=1249101 RepID=A0A1X0C311_MYCCF|nr:hydrogenase nickel incorporation protein HypB [Mycolicibacterium celeriflavum]MCV7239388.1 hydrogenase nickel incorporation protein HypB [Mycolicibacterium celeriflavum]ORA51760.1 hydrogenase accessory protein HypB [Mycolicibacterium celeriflavum]BBY43079.1 hydrogenase accessory protein HypB [Mycolicibacterium celeriflavum]
MCATCGCGEDGATVTLPGHGHTHEHPHPHHDHDHDHHHEHDHVHTETITLEQKVLAKNDQLAERNRAWLAERDILAFNLTSSPGAGKTTLLERTIRELSLNRPVAVIEGDQETLLDAERIKAAGARAVQVNTGAGCHLDAAMVHRALQTLDPEPGSLLFVENVGNLVCPALFDLGERSKVVVISVTEGDDKPLKYPHMFAAAGLVIFNKIDLLPHVSFDLEKCCGYVRSLNRDTEIVAMSAATGDGSAHWYDWIDDRAKALVP